MTSNTLFEAIQCLKDGKVLLYPTDTIWGLGCDATNAQAVDKILHLKNRPAEKSMIILVADINMLGRYFKHIPDAVFDIEENSDSPITYVLDGVNGIAQNVIHTDGSLGVRIPKNELCIQLIKKFGKPIVSTSANISGMPSPLSYSDISNEIKNGADYILMPPENYKGSNKPSTIIKIKANGEFTFIRK